MSIATGANAEAVGDGAIATGSSAQSYGFSSVAIGDVSRATGHQSVSVGQRANAGGNYSLALGGFSEALGPSSIAIGGSALAGREDDPLTISDDESISFSLALGQGSRSVGQASVAVGSNSRSLADQAIAVGEFAEVSGNNSIVMGSNSKVSGNNSIALGIGHRVLANNSGAIGDPNIINAGADGSYVLGNNNNVSSANSFVVGNNVTVISGLNGAVVLGNQSSLAPAIPTSSTMIKGTQYTFAGGMPSVGDVVSIGSSAAPRQIQNLAAGQLNSLSTDAVNGSQLFATNQAIGDIATVANQGFVLQQTGVDRSTVNPGDKVNFLNGANTTASVSTEANGVINVTFNVDAQAITQSSQLPVVYTDNSGNKLYKQSDGSFNTMADGTGDIVGLTNIKVSMQNASGSTTSPTRLSNVAQGVISNTSTDVINGSQVYDVADSIKSVLGGNAALNTNGTISMSNIGGTGKSTVDEAIRAVNTSATNAINNAVFGVKDQKGQTITAPLNNTVQIVGGASDIQSASSSNVKTEVKSGKLELQIVDAPTFNGAVTAQSFNTSGSHKVVMSGAMGTITGLSNTTLGASDFGQAGRAATEEQLALIQQSLNQMGGGWSAIAAQTGSGKVTGNAIVPIVAGSTVTYTAGNNIHITQNGSNFTIATNDEIVYEKVSIANGGPTLSSSGINAGGKVVSNVGAGVRENDAVNVGQLNSAINNLTQSMHNVNQAVSQVYAKTDEIRKDANAGVAGAIAAASLPQVGNAGASMVSAAGGSFKGQSALAIGFSRSSENGHWVTKANASTNTRGDIGIGAGVGYQW